MIICRAVNLHVISWLLEKSMTVIMVALPVVFQPELRRALEQIGRGKLFRKGSELDEQELNAMLDDVANATKAMSASKVGALMVFERAAFPMEEIAEQRPNAAFSADPAERERLAAEGNIVQPLKWHLNLPLCNKQILLHCGVAEENIQDCGICTFQHSDEYFSARKLGIESGRIYTGILLK